MTVGFKLADLSDSFEPRASVPLRDARLGTRYSFSGNVTQVIYHNPDDGYFIAIVEDGDEEVKVTGRTMFLAKGVGVVVTGTWGEDKRPNGWGSPILLNATSVALADQASAMRVLLASGFLVGIKEVMAERVFQTFGELVFAKLDESLEDPTVLQEVKGIGAKNCILIIESWKEQRHWAQAALISIRAGLSVLQAREAYQEFGMSLIPTINDNPYLLTRLTGINWDKSDQIAAMEWPGKTKIDHDDPKRYVAAVREVLRLAYNDGDMAMTAVDAISKAKDLAKPTIAGFERKAIERFTSTPSEGLVAHGEWLFLKNNYLIEQETAAGIKRLMNRRSDPIGDWATIKESMDLYANVPLSPDQEGAVQAALANRLIVITGGPGTGKTTTLRTLCNIMESRGLAVTLCAPTGKAARRMSEATGRPAATIHRTLGIMMHGERNMDFTTPVVMIDEASMIDAAIMLEVVSACVKDGVRLILIGDVDQLPPVGAGEPFYQIIQSGAVVVRLTHIHRQGKNSGIVHVAHGFNHGQIVNIRDEKYEDIEIFGVSGNDSLAPKILSRVDRLIESGVSLDDIVVLTPVNGHDWGQEALNRAMQDKYNTGPVPLAGVIFKEGDKVIHTKNVYDMRGQTVLNGMTGRVISVATVHEEKELDLKRHMNGEDGLPIVVWVDFDGEPTSTSYTRSDLVHLKLAYAMTIHKSQGSEYDYVVMVTPFTHPNFMLRQLPYTGLTRAKKYCIIISAQSALRTYVENEERVRRVTFLAKMINELLLPADDGTEISWEEQYGEDRDDVEYPNFDDYDEIPF